MQRCINVWNQYQYDRTNDQEALIDFQKKDCSMA